MSAFRPVRSRIVIDLIRGKSVPAAREILQFSDRAIAEVVAKTLNSAVANAENQHHVRPETLHREGRLRRRRPHAQAHPSPRQGLRFVASASARATSPSSLLPRKEAVSRMGQKVKPHRLPSRHHRGLAFPLVRRQGLRQEPGERLEPSGSSWTSSSPVPPSPRSRSSAPATRSRSSCTTARPGVVIGKKGAEIDRCARSSRRSPASPVSSSSVVEVKRPELDAALVAQSIAEQLEGRVAFRRAMRKAVQSARKSRRQGHPYPVLRPSRRCRDEPSRVVSRGSRAAAHPACQDRLRFRPRLLRPMGSMRRAGVGVPAARVLPRPARLPSPALEGSSRAQPSPSQRS